MVDSLEKESYRPGPASVQGREDTWDSESLQMLPGILIVKLPKAEGK